MSYADVLQHWTFAAIQDAQGPDFGNNVKFGRVEATAEEAATFTPPPNPADGTASWLEGMQERGFEQDEIVALAYTWAFGVVQHKNQTMRSSHAYFDNYWFRFLTSSTQSTGPIDEIIRDDRFSENVELFGQDKKAFYETYTRAFIKASYRGTDEANLRYLDDMLDEDDEFGLHQRVSIEDHVKWHS